MLFHYSLKLIFSFCWLILNREVAPSWRSRWKDWLLCLKINRKGSKCTSCIHSFSLYRKLRGFNWHLVRVHSTHAEKFTNFISAQHNLVHVLYCTAQYSKSRVHALPTWLKFRSRNCTNLRLATNNTSIVWCMTHFEKFECTVYFGTAEVPGGAVP